jgi:hypothetical protein
MKNWRDPDPGPDRQASYERLSTFAMFGGEFDEKNTGLILSTCIRVRYIA